MKKNLILKDYIYAGFFQFLNVISPFLILYFFLPIIGKSYYSNIILITAAGSYFKLVYEFGFDYFTAKRVSKDSTVHTKEIVFSGVFSAKIILALIFFIPQLFVSMILINDREFYFVILYCLSNILFSMVPNWYFLALQKFKQMAFLNLICHSLIILCCFLLITEEKYWYHYATGFLVGHLIQFIISLFVVDLKSTSLNSVFNINLGKKYLLNSFAILKFNILSNIYISSSVIILRILKTPPELITDFGIAEKVIRGIRQIISPINRIAYPRLIKIYKKSIIIYNNRLIRFSLIIFSVGIILSYLVYENSLLIYKILNYPVNDDLIIFTNLLLPILTIGSLGGFLCVNKFIARNREKQLIKIMLITSITFIVVSPFLIYSKSAVGGAIAVIFSELLLFILVIFKK